MSKGYPDRQFLVALQRAQRRASAGLAALMQAPHELARPEATRKRLISTLFGRASNVLMVAVAAAICGATAWLRGGHWASALVASTEVSLLLFRCLVILAYKKREERGAKFDPAPWLVSFGLLAIASSMSWGVLCLVALATSSDPLLYVLPILSTVGTAGAVAARNSGVPRLAKAQLFCSLAPICGGCVLPVDHGLRLLLLLVPAMAAGLVIVIAERNQQLVDLIETQAELGRLSQTDALTQLPNRRSLDEAIGAAADAGFALLMIDVDNFKAFNDRHGHLIGDAILRKIALILEQTVRKTDGIVARYGGEEFAVLLRGAGRVELTQVGERLRLAVQNACCDPNDGIPVTISIGGAISRAGHHPRIVIREADEALYKAKRGGRNRIEFASASGVESVAA